MENILKEKKLFSIPNIEGYLITEYGEVFSLRNQRFLSPRETKGGYLDLNMTIKGKKTKLYIHKLVALTFLGKSTLPVRHKDGKKNNNYYKNLEYINRG